MTFFDGYYLKHTSLMAHTDTKDVCISVF